MSDQEILAFKKKQAERLKQQKLDQENRVTELTTKLIESGIKDPIVAERRARAVVATQIFYTGFGKSLKDSNK